MPSESPQPPRLPVPVLLIGLVLMGLGVWVAHYLLESHQPSLSKRPAHYLSSGKPLTGFKLIDYNLKPFTPSRFKGKWTFLFFGYTNCPDVCPTTLLKMRLLWNKMPASVQTPPKPQMVFVSVDPRRDTPSKLKEYVKFYRSNFLGVTGKAKQINILIHQVGGHYTFTKNPDGKGYTVNHSAQIILVDPKGEMRAVFSPPQKVDELLHSYIKIRNYYNLQKVTS